MKKATLLPLEYSPRRVEHAVCLQVIAEWSELQELLTDPASYMKAQQWLWHNAGPVWELSDDATLILEPLFNQPQGLSVMAESLGINLPWSDGGPSSNGFLSWEKAALDRYLSTYEAIQDNLDQMPGDPEEKGAFYAEFTVGTHVITVGYILPKTVGATLRHKNKVLSPTLGLQSANATIPASGALHFDLTGDAVDRADFCMDWIENNSLLVATDLNTKDIKLGNLQPVDSMDNNSVLRPVRTANQVAGVVQFEPIPGLPRIVIENTDPTPPMCVCGVTPVNPGPGNTLLLGTLFLKDYEVKPCIGTKS